MKKLTFLMLVLVLALTCVSLVSCGGGEKEEATPESTSTTKPEEKPTAKPEATPTKGESASGGFTWDDMPIYPGAEADKDALDVAGASGEGRMEWRHYKTGDSLEKVASYYKKEMSKNGWQQVKWGDVKMTKANWTRENGIYAKNEWHDDAFVTITDKGEGVVHISLMRSNDQEEAASADRPTSEPAADGKGGFTWDDMPIYPGATTDKRAWTSISQGELRSESRPYWTGDSLDDVAHFYKSEMPKNGWGQVMWTQTGEMAMGIYGKNNDQDIAQVIIADKADKGMEGIQIALQRSHENK